MNENRSLLIRLSETLNEYRAGRRRARAQDTQLRPSRLCHFLRWLTPNGGTLVLVALLLCAYHAWAAPNPAPQADAAISDVNTGLLSYQGYLTDAGGTPLDGGVGVTFRLYSVPTGGPALWTEAHAGGNTVPVSDGLFNVMLGSLTPIPSSVWASGAAYLGVQVGSDPEMTPREVVGAVPVAGMARTVPDGSIESGDLALDYGTVCLSSHATVDLPGDYEAVAVPGLTLDFSLDRPSQVMVWMDGLARFVQSSNGEADIILRVDGSDETTSFGCDTDDIWFNVEGQRLINLDSGSHNIQIFANSQRSGSMVVHGVGGYRTCINYLVLGEQ